MKNVELRLREDGQTWRLGAVDAESAEDDHLGWVTWTVDLPDGGESGPATLLPGRARPVEVRIL